MNKYWEKIAWNGKDAKKNLSSPSIDDFTDHVKNLYSNENYQSELLEIQALDTNIHIPVLDKPIDEHELLYTYKDLSKGGFDYNVQIISIMMKHFSATLLLLFNYIFFLKYPLTLACSMMFFIFKKGSTKLPGNYRGIQMLKSLACFYDRILYNRLKLWLNFHDDQTAFQKGKNTLIHLFTMRILIFLANKKNTTLYVAAMDIEKAFDIVPRLTLLRKLVSLGIGKTMLYALKEIYNITEAIIWFNGDYSDPINMENGIRQGASSSVLLFNVVMNDLFNYLERHCDTENILNNIHVLVHADDTLVLSTSRNKFINKCNKTIQYFRDNNLRLNISKSYYLIINPGRDDLKTSINLSTGTLKYASKIVYLGVLITDCGSLANDVKSYLSIKRCNVSVKFLNYCQEHKSTPLWAKIDVLDKCVVPSLLYACETWGEYLSDIEVYYRAGLKTALNIRENVNNEIVYTETSALPLICRIRKQQTNFWLYIMDYIHQHPDAAIAKVIKQAEDENIPYIKSYKKLVQNHTNGETCFNNLKNEHLNGISSKMEIELNKDPDSRLGMYKRINPDLTPYIPKPQNLLEMERTIITRFRTGSHSLKIELGRYLNIERERRLCICEQDIQNIWHVFMECDLTRDITNRNYANLTEIFSDENLHIKLLKITNCLNIPI